MLFEFLFFLIFAVAVCFIGYQLVRGILQWHRNNQSPRLTETATVVTKRSSVSSHQTPMAGDVTGAHGYSTTTSTSYYVTFETANGARMELHVPEKIFGYLAEGDRGQLSYQGTRFLDFER